MNWNEGNLVRHSKRGRGRATLLKQKEHFAKARSAPMINSVKAGLPDISFMHSGSSSRSHRSLHSTSSSLDKVRTGKRLSAGAGTSGESARRGRRGSGEQPGIASRFWSNGSNDASPNAFPRADKRIFEADESLTAKRRRLLLKRDWVGTNVQKPIPLESADFRRTTRNGKWTRALGGAHLPIAARHLLGDRFDQMKLGNFPPVLDPELRLKNQDVKVTVGSQYMRLGDSSTIWKRRTDRSSSTACSRRTCSSVHSSRSCRGRRNRRYEHQTASKESSSRRDPTSTFGDTLSSRGVRRLSKRSQGPIRDSSPPALIQPLPQRPLPLHILRRRPSDSEVADSTVAQVGQTCRVISPTRAQEDDQWREYILGSESIGDSVFNALNPVQPEISPGISEHPLKGAGHGSRCLGSSPGLTAPSVRRRSEEVELEAFESPLTSKPDGIKSLIDVLSIDMTINVQPDEAQQEATALASQESRINIEHQAVADDLHNASCQEGILVTADADHRFPSRYDEPAIAPQRLPHPGHSEASDTNEVWKRFIFSGTDGEDVELDVFNDAKHEVVRELHLSSSLENGTESNILERYIDGSTIAATCRSDMSYAGEEEITTSNVGTSYPGAFVSPSSLGYIGSLNVNSGGSTQSGARVSTSLGTSTGRAAPGLSDPSSDSVSLLVLPPTSEDADGTLGEPFRFAPPKPFVGKHADSASCSSYCPEPVRPGRDKRKPRGVGRPKRKRDDGRPNIARLPNYAGDPIEDYSDEMVRDGAQDTSLFGPLETE